MLPILCLQRRAGEMVVRGVHEHGEGAQHWVKEGWGLDELGRVSSC